MRIRTFFIIILILSISSISTFAVDDIITSDRYPNISVTFKEKESVIITNRTLFLTDSTKEYGLNDISNTVSIPDINNLKTYTFLYKPTSPLENGHYLFTIIATDNVGNDRTKTKEFEVNISFSNITLTNPPYGVTNVTPFNLSIHSSKPMQGCKYQVVSPPYTPVSYVSNIVNVFSKTNDYDYDIINYILFGVDSSTEDNPEHFYVTCNNTFGVTNDNSPNEFILLLDRTKPVVTVTSIPNLVVDPDLKVILKVESQPNSANLIYASTKRDKINCRFSNFTNTNYFNMEYKFYQDDSFFNETNNIILNSTSTSHSPAIQNLNNYNYYVQCKNRAGILSDISEVSFDVNTDTPGIITYSGPSGRINNKKPILNLTTNIPANCTYTKSNSLSSYTFIKYLNNIHSILVDPEVSDGNHSYYVECKFNKGGSTSTYINFTVDTTQPLTPNISTGFACSEHSLSAEITSSDTDTAKFQYKLLDETNDNEIQNNNKHASITITGLDLVIGNTYSLIVSAIDFAGNPSNPRTLLIQILDPNEPNCIETDPPEIYVRYTSNIHEANITISCIDTSGCESVDYSYINTNEECTDYTSTFYSYDLPGVLKVDHSGKLCYKASDTLGNSITGNENITLCNIALDADCDGYNNNDDCAINDATHYINMTGYLIDANGYTTGGPVTICTDGTLPSTYSANINGPLCGNGVLNPLTEECDDGNVLSDDGCSSSCKVESLDPDCVLGTSLCADGTCRLDCGDGNGVVCNSDNVCDVGEGCDCADCKNVGDAASCASGLTCSLTDTGCCNGVSDKVCTLYCSESDLDCTSSSSSTDIDRDGMPDSWELEHGLDPNNSVDAYYDPDNDGLINLDEYLKGTDPNNPDTDGDGWLDGEERTSNTNIDDSDSKPIDTDGDGLPNDWQKKYFGDEECQNIIICGPNADPDNDELTNLEEYLYNTNPNNADTDGDGLIDSEEVSVYHTNPTKADTDGDSYSDKEEINAGSDPLNPRSKPVDTDNDGMPDWWQKKYFGSITCSDDNIDVCGPNADPDKDGLRNKDEYKLETDPNNHDTDGDSWFDGAERTSGTNPLDPNSKPVDTDGDGLDDKWEKRYFKDLTTSDGKQDPDEDNSTDYEEYLYNTNPLTSFSAHDTDIDGMPDWWQKKYFGNITCSNITICGPNVDPDKDGLTNFEEFRFKTDPNNPDTDSDSWFDGAERTSGTNPLDPNSKPVDTDGDGLDDKWELKYFESLTTSDGSIDSDADGISDYNEYLYNTNPVNTTPSIMPNNDDSDNDGMPDWWEIRYGLNPNDPKDAYLDKDSDGLTNLEEYQMATDPTKRDSDGDSWFDGAERTSGTDPLDPNSKPVDTDGDGLDDDWEIRYFGDLSHDSNTDSDKDGLTNFEEYLYDTNPTNEDTDGDGLKDGDEVHKYHTNPREKDTDSDRFSDKEEISAGTNPLDPNDYPNNLGLDNPVIDASQQVDNSQQQDESPQINEVGYFKQHLFGVILLILALFMILGGTGYLLYKKYYKNESISTYNNSNMLFGNQNSQQQTIQIPNPADILRKQRLQSERMKEIMNKRIAMQNALLAKRREQRTDERKVILSSFDTGDKKPETVNDSKKEVILSKNINKSEEYRKIISNNIKSQNEKINQQITSKDNVVNETTNKKLESIIKNESVFDNLDKIGKLKSNNQIKEKLNVLTHSESTEEKLEKINLKSNTNSQNIDKFIDKESNKDNNKDIFKELSKIKNSNELNKKQVKKSKRR